MNGRRLLATITLALLIIAVMGVSGTGVLADEEPQFILEINDPVIDVEAYTTLTLTVVNAKGAKLLEFVGTNWFYMPYNDSFFTNKEQDGKTAYLENESYRIYPYYAGQFKLWALIEYEGKTYMTNKVQLNVTDSSSADSGQPRKASLNTMLTKNQVYIGQKTVLAYEVYSIYDLNHWYFLDDLQINDVLLAGTPEEKLRSEKAVYDGAEYNRTEVEISYLTPIKSGIFTVPGRSFYGYISETEQLSSDEYTVREFSEPKELIVRPLPTKNQPTDFSWIIGKPEINARYNTLNAADGSTILLTVTVSGDCNIDSLKKIFKEDPPGFSAYETVKMYTESLEDNRYNARKEFEITLIPKENGTLTIDPVHISYFDPDSGSYKTAEIPGLSVTVEGADRIMQPDEIRSGGDRPEDHVVETVRIEQISYAPKDDGFWVLRISKTVALVIIIMIPVMGAVAFLLIKRPAIRSAKRDEQLDDIYAQLVKAGDENEIYNHFNSMIRHCFGVSPKASSRSEIAEGIQDKRFVDPILEVMEYIEKEKFVPGKVDNELLKMIKEVYKSLKRR